MTTSPPPRAPRWVGWTRPGRRHPWVAVERTRAPTFAAAWQLLLNVVRTSADLLVMELGRDPNRKVKR